MLNKKEYDVIECIAISIIMPAYNAQKYITEAIGSVINQTYLNWELIIIDDGSIDDTAQIAKTYRETDRRIKYIYQENAKQGKARNAGLAMAQGDLIAFLDSDDLWLPERLDVMVNELKIEDVDMLFSDAYYFEGSLDVKHIASEQCRFNIHTDRYAGEAGLNKFLMYNRVPMLATLIKKKALFDVGLFSDRGICEDYEMWLKLLLNGCKMRSIDKPLAAYRIHENATTSQDKIASDHCIDIIYSLKNKLPSNKYNKLFNKSLIHWYLKKLERISTISELQSFFNLIRKQKVCNDKLFILPTFGMRFLFNLNKRIFRHTLLQCQHQFLS